LKEVVLAAGPQQRCRHLLTGGGPPVSRLQDPTVARILALAGEGRFRKVDTLTVVGRGDDTIAALAEVPDLKSLEWLILGNTAVTSAGLITLGNSKHLRKLTQFSVEGGSLTDKDFEWVRSEATFPSLTELSLRRLHLTDTGLPNIAYEDGAFARLTDLTLQDMPVTSAGLRRLVVDSAALTRLELDGLLPANELLPLLFARTDRPMNILAGGLAWSGYRSGAVICYSAAATNGQSGFLRRWQSGRKSCELIAFSSRTTTSPTAPSPNCSTSSPRSHPTGHHLPLRVAER
jgi:hypothetical protein